GAARVSVTRTLASRWSASASTVGWSKMKVTGSSTPRLDWRRSRSVTAISEATPSSMKPRRGTGRPAPEPMSSPNWPPMGGTSSPPPLGRRRRGELVAQVAAGGAPRVLRRGRGDRELLEERTAAARLHHAPEESPLDLREDDVRAARGERRLERAHPFVAL